MKNFFSLIGFGVCSCIAIGYLIDNEIINKDKLDEHILKLKSKQKIKLNTKTLRDIRNLVFEIED